MKLPPDITSKIFPEIALKIVTETERVHEIVLQILFYDITYLLFFKAWFLPVPWM